MQPAAEALPRLTQQWLPWGVAPAGTVPVVGVYRKRCGLDTAAHLLQKALEKVALGEQKVVSKDLQVPWEVSVDHRQLPQLLSNLHRNDARDPHQASTAMPVHVAKRSKK